MRMKTIRPSLALQLCHLTFSSDDIIKEESDDGEDTLGDEK